MLEAMGFRVVDVTDYSDRPFTDEWLPSRPPCPGVYELRCMENDDKPEVIPVARYAPDHLRSARNDQAGLWAQVDGLWNPLSAWHDGLTDVMWRRLS